MEKKEMRMKIMTIHLLVANIRSSIKFGIDEI